MAKGDHSRAQSSNEFQSGTAQNNLNNTRSTIGNQNQNMWNNYTSGVDRNNSDYSGMMGRYNNYMSNLPNVGLSRTGDVNSAISGYKGFAENGGFSPQDVQNMRARAINPTRAVYQNYGDQMQRQRALQGGYSPNFNAASSKMARDLSSQVSDANVNADASIAQMIQEGKLAGLGGLSNTALNDQAQGLDASKFNAQLPLQAMSGATSLYGTTPALASTFGNQVLNSSGQAVNLQGQQNDLSLGTTRNQIATSQIPGNYQQALGNVSGTLGLAGQVGGMFGGLGGPTSGMTTIGNMGSVQPQNNIFQPVSHASSLNGYRSML